MLQFHARRLYAAEGGDSSEEGWAEGEFGGGYSRKVCGEIAQKWVQQFHCLFVIKGIRFCCSDLNSFSLIVVTHLWGFSC